MLCNVIKFPGNLSCKKVSGVLARVRCGIKKRQDFSNLRFDVIVFSKIKNRINLNRFIRVWLTLLFWLLAVYGQNVAGGMGCQCRSILALQSCYSR